MVKRLALALLLVSGCTTAKTPTTPAPAASVSPPAATPSVTPSGTPSETPLPLTTYDAGDFQVGVPAGWEQVAKDQPLSKSINRASFRWLGADGKVQGTFVITSGPNQGTTLADQFELLKAATLQQGETITAQSQTEAGEPFGLRSTSTTADGTSVNYRFVVVGPQTLYLIGLSCPQGGAFTDSQALQVIESFTLTDGSAS